MIEKRSGADAYRGKEHEFDLFGTFDTSNPKYHAALDALLKERGKEKMGFQNALELVRRVTPDERAENPEKEFLRDLRIEVMDRLGGKLPDDTVHAYSSLGTPLDVYYGTDAFLVIKMKKGGEIVVTIDATIEDFKLKHPESAKANIVLGHLPSPEDEDRYLAAIGKIADQIALRVLRFGARQSSEPPWAFEMSEAA